jgi:hypothetical protein
MNQIYLYSIVGLSFHNLKPLGVGYITVTQITIVHILLTKNEILFHALYLKYCRCLIHFSHNCPTSAKDMLPFNKYKNFTLLLKFSTLHALFGLEDYHNIYPAFQIPFVF